MKKLMTSTIIILPLIILAIMLVSGAIVSLVTHIYVEKVEFSNNEAIVLVMNDEQNPPTHNLREEINVFPLEAPNRDLVYTGYDTNLLKISDDGIVTPIFYGETYVTVQSKENKAATATRKIIVTDESVHAVKFNDYEKDMYEGESVRLSVGVFPQEAENKTIDWSSSDDSVLHVSANGTVTAMGNGTVTVTAASKENPEVKDVASITCHARLRNLIFDDSLLQTSLAAFEFPEVTSDPAECDCTLKYSSSNTDIASVDGTGNVTFKKAGKVTITVKGTDFKGNSVEKQKTVVSTMGYFVGPLFDANSKQIKFDDCISGSALPLNFVPRLEGTYQKINSVKYMFDPPTAAAASSRSGEWQQGLITYDEQSQKFMLEDDFPAFNSYVRVVVNATVYSNATDELDSTYADEFYIVKTEVPENAKVSLADGTPLKSGVGQSNEILIEDIGDDVRLNFENPDNMVVSIVGTQFVKAVVQDDKIILTGDKVVENDKLYISIGSQVFNLDVTVRAKAQWIKVKCGERQLETGEEYNTLLSSLTFTVEVGRDDGQKVESPVKYQVNSTAENTVDDGSITLTIDQSQIRFTCDDQQFAVTVKKVALSDFGFDAVYSTAAGVPTSLKNVPSANAQSNIQLTLPKDSLNAITLNLNISDFESYLGGLGTETEFKALFNVTATEKVILDYDVSNKHIIITPDNPDFNENLTLTCGAIQVKLNIVKVTIEKISFVKGTESFDIGTPQDVYKGYQQVRLFAKHSYYNGAEVDYFRMPLKVLSKIAPEETPASVENTINAVNWTLSGYKEQSLEEELTTQKGDTVTIGGTEYKIVKVGDEYVLQDGDGTTVSGEKGKNDGGYIWIDVFSEAKDGYVRIYFGNFGGLSEVDVQNDYFGDFGEQGEDWEKVNDRGDYVERDDNGKDNGRKFNASENAYKFLQVKADDGTPSGKNCHFNFNVLADPTDSKLVNVFDADGYYKNNNIVLHTNLYGSENKAVGSSDKYNVENQFNTNEIEKTDDNKDLFLTSTSNLDKNLIYGNGFSVSYNAMNEYLRSVKLPMGQLGNSGGVNVRGVYNATLRGRNATDTFSENDSGIVFVFQYCYYSNIQHYYKCSPYGAKSGVNNKGDKGAGGVSYFKNSVINKAIKGIQLYYDYAEAYFENMVIYDCIMAVCAEGTGYLGGIDPAKPKSGEGHYLTAVFQGEFNDVLNYQSLHTLMASMTKSPMVSMALQSGWKSVENYGEWFGKSSDNNENHSATQKERFINPVVFAVFYATNSDKPQDLYDRMNQVTVKGSGLKAILDLSSVIGLPIPGKGWSYAPDISSDGGKIDASSKTCSREDFKKLFTPDRDIRLLCEYLDVEKDGTPVKNTEHILWHIQKVYRDMSLIGGREPNHIEALKQSLISARDSGKVWDGIWPDNTTLQNALDDVNKINTMLSQAIVPGKREYSVI